LKLAEDKDPIDAITEKARQVVVAALDEGWSGPPFDPLWLAAFLNLDVIPREDVGEARTVPVGKTKFRIEFNPNRPRGRQRYSLAHEIAHTLFADCGERIRHRASHEGITGDDWQLEALCNVAASEFLMPFGSMPTLSAPKLGVDHLMKMRKDFDVSTEALFIRAARITDEVCAMFCASAIERGGAPASFRIEYMIGSRAWGPQALPRGTVVPTNSVVGECSAIGFTAKRLETWGGAKYQVECVGVPPYPGALRPRIIGLILPESSTPAPNRLRYLHGDALQPRGEGKRLIVHLVNDATPNWGGAFAQALRKRWQIAQDDFRAWASDPKALKLGNVRFVDVEENVTVATVVGQKGYGPSPRPRIRYQALSEALFAVGNYAAQRKCTVHMPRIGCGEAGGRWDVVQEIVSSRICRAGSEVTVYDLPGREAKVPAQESLFS